MKLFGSLVAKTHYFEGLNANPSMLLLMKGKKGTLQSNGAVWIEWQEPLAILSQRRLGGGRR